MPTGYKISSGVDLDSLFMAMQIAPAASATGFKNSSGIDLSQVFQKYVSGTKVAATGFKTSSGTDLCNVFQNAAVPLLAVTANNVTKTSGPAAAFCGAYLSTGGPNTIVTGGSGSYTYSWTRMSACHSSGCLAISSATAQNPTWAGSACDGDVIESETWRVTVTDTSYGVTAFTDISVTRRHFSTS